MVPAPIASGKAIYASQSNRLQSDAVNKSPVLSPRLESREEFAAQAKDFFGLVQDMKDRGEWRSRGDYRRMTQHGNADEEAVDIWSSSGGSSVRASQVEQEAVAPLLPSRACPVLLGFTQEASACDQHKAEFAAEAKYFFNAVQDMKEKGQWQARRDYKRMTQLGVENAEEMDIWKGASEDPPENMISDALPVRCAEETPELSHKVAKAKFTPRVLLGSEVTQQEISSEKISKAKFPPRVLLGSEVTQQEISSEKISKAKFPPRVLLGSEVTQQDVSAPALICDGRKMEFAEQAQYFFGAVQDMKDKGQWQARQDYKRMTLHHDGADVIDIWS